METKRCPYCAEEIFDVKHFPLLIKLSTKKNMEKLNEKIFISNRQFDIVLY